MVHARRRKTIKLDLAKLTSEARVFSEWTRIIMLPGSLEIQWHCGLIHLLRVHVQQNPRYSLGFCPQGGFKSLPSNNFHETTFHSNKARGEKIRECIMRYMTAIFEPITMLGWKVVRENAPGDGGTMSKCRRSEPILITTCWYKMLPGRDLNPRQGG